jgi:hypothetical protein
VTIQVSDGERTGSQDISVTVTDVAEGASATNASTPADSVDTPDEDGTPVTPTDDDTPTDIDLPDWSLFVNDFALGSIVLPESVVTIEDSTLPDLTDLIGLLGDQGESLALDFAAIDADTPVVASVESVKPVVVDWTGHPDPFIDSHWNPIIEELFYTTEVG